MSFQDYFSRASAGYAAYRPTYPPALVEYLAGLAPGRELALDCGCGTGQLSVLLAEHFSQVIATDASAKQIEQAQAHERVAYRVALAEESGLPPGCADLITVAQAAHWIDLERFYREVRRLARPHAAIALITYGILDVDEEIAAVVQRFYRDVIGPYWPPGRKHVEDGYRSFAFPFEEIVTSPKFAMTAAYTLREFLGYVATWSAFGQAAKVLGTGPAEEFREELSSSWGDAQRQRVIRWPISLRVGHVD